VAPPARGPRRLRGPRRRVGPRVGTLPALEASAIIWHVVPVNDSAPHRDIDCWCEPTPSREEPRVLVHHSADGRELVEKEKG